MRLAFLTLFVLGALLCASGATAAPRSISFSDPQDAADVLEGLPNEDIQRVELGYDKDAGTINVEVTFYRSISPHRHSGGWGSDDLNFDFWFGLTKENLGCTLNFTTGSDAFVTVYVNSGQAKLSVEGYSGESYFQTVTVSPNGRVLSAVVTHPGLVGRDYRCAEMNDLWSTRWRYWWCNFSGCSVDITTVDRIAQWEWLVGFGPDTAPPRVRPFPANGVSRKPITFRYRVSDDSGRARVKATLARGGSIFRVKVIPMTAVDPRRTYSLRWQLPKLRGKFSFCVSAVDEVGNRSRTRCAVVHVRRTGLA